ncbi:MAG: hypothetical protein VX475_14885, partial [Myxococcota bacterium]|nr:hypothetical protein [Myxococcota bacterium]
MEEITALIEEAALEQARLSWEELEARAGEIAVARRSQELTSPLLAALPYGPAHARAATAAAALTPVEPALGDIHADRPADGQREWAMYEWLKLLHEGGEYELRLGRKCAREKRRRFNSIWYTFQLTEHYPKPLHSTVLLPEGIDVNPRRSSSSKHAAAFISRRRDLEQPPAREVYLRRDDPPKPLQFLGYGGRLHDDLVRGWLDQLSETPEVLEVTLPRTHPFFDHAAPGTYALSFGLLEASPMLEALTPDISTLISAEGEPSLKTVSDLFEDAVAATAHSHDLADTRWLRALLPAQLLLELSPLTGTPAPSDSLAAAYALLDPRAVVSNPITDKDEVFLGFGAGVDSPRLLALLNSARGINEDAMLKRGKQSWSHRRPTLRARAESRAWVIEEDATRDADVRAVDVDAREAELEELEGGLLTRRKNELTSRLLIDAMHTSIDARRAARL